MVSRFQAKNHIHSQISTGLFGLFSNGRLQYPAYSKSSYVIRCYLAHPTQVLLCLYCSLLYSLYHRDDSYRYWLKCCHLECSRNYSKV